jgi:hypothetical protein
LPCKSDFSVCVFTSSASAPGYPALVFTNLRQFAGNLRFPVPDTFFRTLTPALGRFALIFSSRRVGSQSLGFATIQNAEHG